MDLIEMTRNLGAALQQDARYLRYLQAKERRDADEALETQIKELNLIRIKHNAEMSKSGDAQDKEKIAQLTKEFNILYTDLLEHPVMVEYNAARAEIDALMNHISGILNLCVNGEDPATCEPPESCGGDCSGCAGCS